ncbi:hypothetical protein, partial [Vibrio parahaemolyticus]|uniref:hypothetical protein n=1 Tax=Vibrio parahaemolyticus TaxID=670 RepID=UPI00211357F5
RNAAVFANVNFLIAEYAAIIAIRAAVKGIATAFDAAAEYATTVTIIAIVVNAAVEARYLATYTGRPLKLQQNL